MVGALYATVTGKQYGLPNGDVGETASTVHIDASRISQIYSEISTVQPPAFQALIIIKA